MNVLVAEDDKFLVSAYRAKFSRVGFDVRVATDGAAALDALKDFTPDVILLDLVMPGMDGFAALEAIKAKEDYKNIPIIVASNLGQKEDLDKAKALGADDYVIKSDLSLDRLIEKMTALATGNGASDTDMNT